MGDARRRYADDLLGAAGIAAAMSGIHAVDAGEPEEEFALLEESFAAWSYTLRYDVPEYARWLAGQDGAFAYGVHRRTHAAPQLAARHPARRRAAAVAAEDAVPPRRAGDPGRPTYPDAIFIQTHRDPAGVHAVLAQPRPSRSGPVRGRARAGSRAGDKAALGAQQLEFMSRMLDRRGPAARRRTRPSTAASSTSATWT